MGVGVREGVPDTVDVGVTVTDGVAEGVKLWLIVGL